MPVKLTNGMWVQPSTEWSKTKADDTGNKNLEADENFYIKQRRVN